MANKMQIIVRKAETKDIQAVTKLHKEAVGEINSAVYPLKAIKEWLSEISEENTRQQLRNSNWVVAEMNSKIVGFGQYSIADGEIYQINVSPDYLNRGIGKRLYDNMENNFRKNGKKRISLNSTINAIEFYQKLGFRIVGNIKFKLIKQTLKMEKMEKYLGTQK